jgi:phosphoribosylaminoimidazolecarboxamide formyltransferase / IMP cyclohydrolase
MTINSINTNKNRPLALVSVTDKSGLKELARQLVESGYELLSTGGTAAFLREAGMEVLDVAKYIDFPELLDGRVKTLHPWIHAGILHDRRNPSHVDQMKQHGLRPIDVIVTNLYAFADEAVAKNLPIESAIEHIDIGGPTMRQQKTTAIASW